MSSLVVLRGSPWSFKSKFVGRLSGVPHEEVFFRPGLDETWLKIKLWRSGSWTWGDGEVSVPVLFKEGEVLRDSFDISQWFAEQSEKEEVRALFPPSKIEDIRKWNEKADFVLGYSRSKFFEFLLEPDNPVLPTLVPWFLRPLGRYIGPLIVRQMQGKYADADGKSSLEGVRLVLQELKEGVKAGKGFLLGSFSYADVVMAVALCGLKAPSLPGIRLVMEKNDILRTVEEKEGEFEDLLQWRDGILKKYVDAKPREQ